jgi:hypothetical protein
MSKILHISNNPEESDFPIEEIGSKISDFSQLAISYSSIDSVTSELKEQIIDLLISKLRINGEIIFKFKNLNKIFVEYCNNTLTEEQVFLYIKDITYPTNINKLFSYIVDKYSDLILLKLVEENYDYVVSFGRHRL